MASISAKYIAEADKLARSGYALRAARMLNAAHKKHPRDVGILVALSQVLLRHLAKPVEALKVVKVALKLAPYENAVLQEAIHASMDTKRFTQAEKFADQLIKQKPRNAEQYTMASMALTKRQRSEEAHELIVQALKFDPNSFETRTEYAKSLRGLGRFEETMEVSKILLEENSHASIAFQNYVEAGKMVEEDPVVANVRDKTIPELRELGEDAKSNLSDFLKSLGKANTDTGRHEEAFQNFQDAKEIFPVEHDRTTMREYVSSIKSQLSRADFFGAESHDETRPVLIVGMPRVGSTMLEQVLGAHPEISAVGESVAMAEIQLATGFPRRNGPKMAEFIKSVRPDDIAAMRAQYLKRTADHHPNALRVVDKNLMNFEFLAMFAKMFPKGRVIHARRDPLDNCVSCYMRPLGKFHSYTQGLSSLGQFYREHMAIMDHWKKILPIDIIEISYEDMVADTEGKAREVIDFLGLEWDPACLDFQNSKQHIKTLSAWQVRQPIYKSSVKRWKRYEKFLDPLKKELEMFYPDGFDA